MNNIDEKLRKKFYSFLKSILADDFATDGWLEKTYGDIINQTIPAIKSLFPQELEEKKVTDIIEAVYAHGATTSGMDKDLPLGQMTISEAIQEIMKLQQKKVER